MSNRTTATASPHESGPNAERRWMSVVFFQGEDADTVLEMIDKSGVEVAIQHLSQWDFGDETRDAALDNGYVYDEIPQSPTDRVIRDEAVGYALTYNHLFGYVSLLCRFNPVVEDAQKPVAPPAPLGFERQRAARRPNSIRL
ncbi:hypothetical protein [Microbacterium jejuense]|uniref:hypothetical protein n=1 Tax=Microbacterium jejuense TaxID=1263637 RepID=UPI0031E781D7